MSIEDLPVQSAKSRLLITLVVDTSSSMANSGGIGQLNSALQNWRGELATNEYLSQTGEICLISFGEGGVRRVDPSGQARSMLADPYVPIRDFNPPALSAGGVTPMVEGLQLAFSTVAEKKQRLRDAGLPLAHRPLIYLITDGAPTDERGRLTQGWRTLVPVIRQQEAGKHLLFFALGVRGAAEDVLRGLAPESTHLLDTLEFSRVLQFVSTSIEAVREGTTRDQTASQAYQGVNEANDKWRRIQGWLGGATSA